MTPTDDDIALAKAWMVANGVTIKQSWRDWFMIEGLPRWIRTDAYHVGPDEALTNLATALKPVIASVRPVIERQAYHRAAEVADKVGKKGNGHNAATHILKLNPPEAP